MKILRLPIIVTSNCCFKVFSLSKIGRTTTKFVLSIGKAESPRSSCVCVLESSRQRVKTQCQMSRDNRDRNSSRAGVLWRAPENLMKSKNFVIKSSFFVYEKTLFETVVEANQQAKEIIFKLGTCHFAKLVASFPAPFILV